MKKNIIRWIIYLSGCFIAYPVWKTNMKKELDQYPYTVGDKLVCVGLSLWSWPSAAASGIVYILESDLIDFDKPAKW